MKNKRKEPRWSAQEQESIIMLAIVITAFILAGIVVLIGSIIGKWVVLIFGSIVFLLLGLGCLWVLWQAGSIFWLQYRADHQDDNLIENEQQVKDWVSQVQIKTSDCTQIANTEDEDIIQTQINTTGGTQIIE